MYSTITDVVGKKRINLAYLIQGKEVIFVSMFSDNSLYQIRNPSKVLLITNEGKQLPKGTFAYRELNAFIERKVITTLLDNENNIVKTDKLAGIIKVVLSLDKLKNTDNLEDGNSATFYLGIT